MRFYWIFPEIPSFTVRPRKIIKFSMLAILLTRVKKKTSGSSGT